MPPFTLESFFTICVAILVICLFIRCVASLFRNEPPRTPYCLENRPIQRPYSMPVNYNRRYEYTEKSAKEVIALDTESVSGPGGRSMVARVSLVRRDRKVWDRYVKPLFPVIDYRTPYSGIRERDLVNAEDYSIVRWQVATIIEDCILVGHDLKHDLNGLNLTHPTEDIRDTSEYEPFRKAQVVEERLASQEERLASHKERLASLKERVLRLEEQMEMEQMVAAKEAKDIVKAKRIRKLTNMTRYDACEKALCHVQAMSKAKQVRQIITSTKPKLSFLALHFLRRRIQNGEHSSVVDARAALDLYLLVEAEWEAAIANKYY